MDYPCFIILNSGMVRSRIGEGGGGGGGSQLLKKYCD